MKQTDQAQHVWPVIIVGAGAAGLTAAIFAAREGTPVLVVETRPKPGAKIRVSGGGRCNVLPSHLTLADFHTSGSTHSLRNILFSWPLEAVHAFFERDLGIALKVESTGKVFPQSNDAKEIVSSLLRECERRRVTLRAPFRVLAVTRTETATGPRFLLQGEAGEQLLCRRLILASGGLSLPKTGSDGAGMQIARYLGHDLTPTYAALVPLLNSTASWQELRGVSVRVRLTAEREGHVLEQREGDLLFTHRGYSGPVVLDMSHHLTRPGGESVRLHVHWGGESVADWDARLRVTGKARVGAVLRAHLPRRLVTLLLEHAAVEAQHRVSELPRAARKHLVDTLQDFMLPVTGNEGYATAEVTGGGVRLAEVASQTLESRIVPGLHFCGEILDATGRLGGYNFLWAWVTGRRVGLSVAAAEGGKEPCNLS